jgi:hypothetical protein
MAPLHHSDRDSQYNSEQFQRLMAYNGVIYSMSRSGNVVAATESLFSSRATKQEPTCSITSSAFTTPNADTRRLDS